MNTANKLTLIRVILVPFFMAFLMMSKPVYHWIALVIFIIASVTDWCDGYIARKYNQITTFGKFVDPLADKMLTTAAFVVFAADGTISPWALFIILAREFVVSGVRLVSVAEGKVIAASIWGKLKTVMQMISIIAAIVLKNADFIPYIEVFAQPVISILIWVTVIATVLSGADYLVKNRNLMKLK